MTRLRYVKGDVTETTGGNYKVYSKQNIEIHSHSDIIQTGKEKGVSFNNPKKIKPKTDLKITKVEGPFDDNGKKIDIIKKGEYYSYKATPSRKPTAIELKMLKWATKNDGGKIKELVGVSSHNILAKDGTILIAIAINEDCEKARIYAYFKKPLNDVSVEVKLGPLQHIIIIGTQKHRGDSAITNPASWIRDVGAGSKLMFAHQAIRRLRLNKDIKFSVFMCEDGYKASHIKAVKDSVEKLYGGKFYQAKSAQQIINYLNTGNKDNSATITDERKESPVIQLFFYSHGLIGKIALGMGLIDDTSEYAFGANEVLKLNKEAFNASSHIYSFACRTGLGNSDIDTSIYKKQIKSSTSIGNSMGIPLSNDVFETVQMPLYSAQSIAQKLSNQTGATTYAYLRRSDYEDTLFTKDELAFSDYMKKRKGDVNVELSPKRYGNKYEYLLNSKYQLSPDEDLRWKEWQKIESNYKNIDSAWFDPDGARHNVKAATTPVGVPAEMQTFKPLK